MFWLIASLMALGTNALVHSHDPAEVLQFAGYWAVTSATGIAAGEIILLFLRRDKNGLPGHAFKDLPVRERKGSGEGHLH